MSVKSKLSKSVVELVEFELFCANTDQEEQEILEDGLENLLLVQSCRYGIIGTHVPKSSTTLSYILPNVNDERQYRILMLCSLTK